MRSPSLVAGDAGDDRWASALRAAASDERQTPAYIAENGYRIPLQIMHVGTATLRSCIADNEALNILMSEGVLVEHPAGPLANLIQAALNDAALTIADSAMIRRQLTKL